MNKIPREVYYLNKYLLATTHLQRNNLPSAAGMPSLTFRHGCIIPKEFYGRLDITSFIGKDAPLVPPNI